MASAELPAVCPACGLVFPSVLSSMSRGALRLQSAGNQESCPRCGAMAVSPEGVFEFSRDAVSVIEASPLTLAVLVGLRDIARAATDGVIPPETAIERMEEQAPWIADLLEAYGPRLRRALFMVLVQALSILAAQFVSEVRDTSPSAPEVRKIVHDEVQAAFDEALRGAVDTPPPPSSPSSARAPASPRETSHRVQRKKKAGKKHGERKKPRKRKRG